MSSPIESATVATGSEKGKDPSVKGSSIEDEKVAPNSFEEAGVIEKSSIGPKLDKNGLVLAPQPSDSKDDPLNWPYWLKIFILLQISVLSFVSLANLSFINPAFILAAEHFHVTIVQASYPATISIVGFGIGGLVWTPLGNVYGRRPIILFANAMTILCTGFSAFPSSYGSFIVSRLFTGVFGSAAACLGPGIIADLFFVHQRGKAMGVFAVFLSNSPHVAALCGGYAAQYINWTWTLKLPLILNSVLLFINFFCLPETLFVRPANANAYGLDVSSETSSQEEAVSDAHSASYTQAVMKRMTPWGVKQPGRSLQAVDFLRPFQMLLYPNVFIICLYMAVIYTFCTVGPAFTIGSTFGIFFHFKPGKVGLTNGLGSSLGGLVGELSAGWVLDYLMNIKRRKNDGKVVPEARLNGMLLGALAIPAGLLTFGISLQHHKTTSYIHVLAGAALAAFGVQIQITACYTYLTDCYKAQATDCALILNFAHQLFAFTTGFWVVPFGDRIGFDMTGVVYAVLSTVFFFPVIWLRFYGASLRAKLGSPSWNRGI